GLLVIQALDFLDRFKQAFLVMIFGWITGEQAAMQTQKNPNYQILFHRIMRSFQYISIAKSYG
ncbi:MAG: hypothetical protein KJP19_04575, partial [Deltaproteobacteria bacterium]|nr:hypothetical protein [Deltaproteobacteria bacterium]